MKKTLSLVLALVFAAGLHAQQPGAPRTSAPDPDYLVLTQRASNPAAFGGAIDPQGRSYNFTPLFFI